MQTELFSDVNELARFKIFSHHNAPSSADAEGGRLESKVKTVSDVPNLKPCPFCGNAAKLIEGRLGMWFVRCTGKYECPVYIDVRQNKNTGTAKGASDAWNMREVKS